MIEIIREDLTGCINYLCSGLPPERFYVVDTPVSKTGICKEFDTFAQAEQYAEMLKGNRVYK